MAQDTLTTYGLDRSDEWDAIVRTFSGHDTYWLSGYARAFYLHGDGEPLLVSYEGTDGTRGINVVMLRDVADDDQFSGLIGQGALLDLSTPYGYGGWLIEGQGADSLFSSYEQWCRENRIVSEFVRFHPLLANHISCAGFYDVVRLGEVVHIDLSSPEMIWSNMSSECRNMVRKAGKLGVEVRHGCSHDAYETFKAIYNATMDRVHAEPYYYFDDAFYESLLDDLPQNAQVFWAELEGRTIASSIILSCNGRMSYHLSGSVREYSSLAANNLILHEAALWGCANGYRTLYLGGGVGSGEDSLFKFKRSFYRGELNRFHVGRRVYLQGEYDKLLALRAGHGEPAPDDGFFPQYRGRFYPVECW